MGYWKKERASMKRALIVVDYQRDFVTGSLGFPGAVALAERIAKKIAAYHKSGDVVLFTMDTHTDDYRNTQEGKHLPVPHCINCLLYTSDAADEL